jgi:hypothetical protein
MLSLPAALQGVLEPFAPLFRRPVWRRVQVLLLGALLSPGRRTLTQALRVMGLAQERCFPSYHRVLSHARWSSRQASRTLLQLLVRTFAPAGPLVFALDDTIERRWGKKIQARGIYRDPVRSSRGHFVKASGLRWLSLMLLAPVSWAGRVWALPVVTALCPSRRYCEQRGRRHKELLDWARQMVLQLARWLPGRELIVVGDNAYAALEWLDAVRRHVTAITRLRLDAALYEPAPPRPPGTRGRPRKKGTRLPALEQVLKDPRTCWQRVKVTQWYGRSERELEIATGTAVWYHAGLPGVPLRWVLVRDPAGKLDPAAFQCTDLGLGAVEILTYFVRRWQVEVTFEEVRAHLGVETQRQWSELAIARTTPCLLGLFSLVALVADELQRRDRLLVRRAAWYPKPVATFSDALAAVRREIWRHEGLSLSGCRGKTLKIPGTLVERLTHVVAYAA